MGKSFCVKRPGSKSGAAAMPQPSHFACFCPLPHMWLGVWGTLLGYEKLHRKSWVVSSGKGTSAGCSWGLKWKQWQQQNTGILAHLCLVTSRPSAGAALGLGSPPDRSWEEADPGHKDTQVMRTLGGTRDVTCHVWLRSLCRFFGGNRSLDKFPGCSAHKQVSRPASRWQDRGSAIRRLGARL